MQRLLLIVSMVCLVGLSSGFVSAAEAKKPAAVKKPVAEKKAAEAKPTEATIVRMTIEGAYPEGPTMPGLFAEIQPSLSKTIGRIDAAAADDAVDALWLRIEPLAVGRGKIHELRQALARFRESDKPVYAEMSSGDGPSTCWPRLATRW